MRNDWTRKGFQLWWCSNHELHWSPSHTSEWRILGTQSSVITLQARPGRHCNNNSLFPTGHLNISSTHTLISIHLSSSFLTPIKEDGRKNFWDASHLPSSCILIMPVQLSFPAIFSFSLACVLNIFYTLLLSSFSLTQLALLLSCFDCHSFKQPAFVSLEKNLWYVDCTLLLLWHHQCETGPGYYHIVQTCQIYFIISRRLFKLIQEQILFWTSPKYWPKAGVEYAVEAIIGNKHFWRLLSPIDAKLWSSC